MRFFVYELRDPRDGAIFYVGKGSGDRPAEHVREAQRGKRSRKCDRIRAILDAGLSVRTVIVARFSDEAEAFAAEVARIAEIGLENLTNVLPGGGGIPVRPPAREKSAVFTQAIAASIAKTLRGLDGGKRLLVFGQDLTESFYRWLGACLRDHGEQKVVAALAIEGVNLEVAHVSAATV